MLTRLKVNGFKNLVDVDIRFGPFTCIAGPNGVGKSNLFDAIGFLSSLADVPLIEAARSVRDGRTADVRGLFHRVGDNDSGKMRFEAEMIIPASGIDDLGQDAKANITFLRYNFDLAYRSDESRLSMGGLEIERESLRSIVKGDTEGSLPFFHERQWLNSAVLGKGKKDFISTEGEGSQRKIRLHQNRGDADRGGGRPTSYLASSLPRTVLSRANAAENLTAVLARLEMQSWKQIQLEPSSLRKSNSFTATSRLGRDGANLAATLYRLARGVDHKLSDGQPDLQWIYSKVANRLAGLISEVRRVSVDRDEQRELSTLILRSTDGTSYPALALSDGTLRFLALAVIELDPLFKGVLCLEEPENGIHPIRIPAILQLLRDIATDTRWPIDANNPLRQVIINTHSPAVVAQVDEADLVFAESRETIEPGRRFQRVSFSGLAGTWRTRALKEKRPRPVSKGTILDYLNPVPLDPPEIIDDDHEAETGDYDSPRVRRVIDRPELRGQLSLFGAEPR